MTSLAYEVPEVRAHRACVTEPALSVELVDGRTIIVPWAWSPRLWYGSVEERQRLEVVGDGAYLPWPDLDEDLGVADLVAGCRPGESAASLKRGLDTREAARGAR